MSPIDVTQIEPVITQEIDIDKELKKKQIAKIDLEITQLTRPWPRILEVAHKIAAPVLAIAGAALAFWLSTSKLQDDVNKWMNTASNAKEVAEKAEETAKTAAIKRDTIKVELAQVERNKEAAEADLKEVQAELREAQNMLSTKQQTALLEGQVAIHFKGELLRDDINRLREKLKGAGFTAPPAQRIDHGQGNEVRYFPDTADERKRAEQTGRIVQEFFASNNCPIADLRVNLHKLPAGERPPLAVWLSHSCRSVR